MKKKVALIFGVTGQDGAYLAQLLLKKKYKVVGTDRRSARSNTWRLRRLGIENKVGSLSVGYLADLLFWDINSIDEIPYWMSSDRILNVMKRGNILN